jgi:hypothetical protein
MNEIPGILLGFVLALYFIISIMKYLPFAQKWIDRTDKLTLVPTWTFFAPEPNGTDFYLFFRVFSDDFQSPWRLAEFGKKRAWYSFIWNPNRRHRKAFFDLCQLILTQPGEFGEEMLFGVPYLLILNHVNNLCGKELGELVQFTIARKVPSQSDKLSHVFISNTHQLS